ncbi:DUF4389 domain-containing protein [bacterium]|nr:DUF4389 domain-containing protein [bacterium]
MESPVHYSVTYPEKLSRGLLLLKTFFGYFYVLIPHMICLSIFAIGAMFVMFIAWWAILFTGKYPERMFHFVLRFYRWIFRAYLYFPYYMTDTYPPFTGVKDVPGYDVMNFDIEYPPTLSRGLLLLKTFFGCVYVMIPHMFCLYFVGLWAGILLFLSWWAILFTGMFPQGWFNFIVKTQRWGMRVMAYFPLYMTDVYPDFGLK